MDIKDFLIEKKQITDLRGDFCKPFSKNTRSMLQFDVAEVFYSTSAPKVLRGLHFQKRPFEHDKIVTVIQGDIIDMIVCINPSLPNYGKAAYVCLRDNSRYSVFVPRGYAHGFYVSGEVPAIVGYITNSVHNPDNDTGIYWNSVNIDWPIERPLISERDSKLPNLGDHEW